jgi:hypothetical protein
MQNLGAMARSVLPNARGEARRAGGVRQWTEWSSRRRLHYAC